MLHRELSDSNLPQSCPHTVCLEQNAHFESEVAIYSLDIG